MTTLNVILGITAFISTFLGTYTVKTVLQDRKLKANARKCLEMHRLIDKYMEPAYEFARKMWKDKNEALQKIKAICGHLGVEVKIEHDGIYPSKNFIESLTMAPSIDVIKSLGFMKEYIPEIEEQWQIYNSFDLDSFTSGLSDQHWSIYDELQKVSTDRWKRLNDLEKRQMIHDLAKEYADKKINKETQEN